MPNLGGIEAARRLKTTSPETKVLILTAHKDREYLYEAVSAGVAGYILKDDLGTDLFSTINTIRRGGEYFSPSIYESSLKILIADDDKAFGSVLKQALEDEGYTVDLAKNGVEAVLSFISKSQDCVLLDMDMPRLRGVDALKIIKKLNSTVPIITFSGTVNEEIEETLESGAIKSLTKPFEIND